MVAKRALVVDDSKSARAFLARLLEEQHVEVDAAETAEQAIDYLTHNRPDVIFMDHLMPGMDGFQAVQAIKSNPRTAMIPILMYTSQEGELYLGQARALGAVGVLPKSVAPTDVRTVLQQLHLTAQPEPPTVAAQPDVMEAAVAAAHVADTVVTQLPSGPAMDELVKDEVAALRRHFSEAFEAHAERVVRDVRGMILEVMPVAPEAPPTEPEQPRHSPIPWLLALAASVAAAVLGTLLWQNQQQMLSLRNELADNRSTLAMLTARLAPAPPAAAGIAAQADSADAPALIVKVPFGEAPLAGTRIEQLREFVAKVAALGQKGTVEVRRYAGRFCLSGSSADGYSLAERAMPYIKCDLVADATDAELGNSAPESVAFATALAELRRQHAALLSIDVGAGRVEGTGTPYPEVGGNPPRVPTAAEWNAVAEGNNRVEMRWHPAS